jgi:iron complex outermembrane receptor protein
MNITKQMWRSFHRASILALAATTVVAVTARADTATVSAAAPEAPASAGLDEIVVTATRRESNLQSTPIAVTAIDAQAIANIQPRSIQDLAMLVPNFSVNRQNGFNAAAFAMRGVGNTDIIVYNEAPVAVLIDDFVMPSVQTQMLDPFDVQELEVLRGPQGTLFGKNTTGGAVVVTTKRPVLDETSFDAEGGGGRFNEFNARGALNIPLIDNQVALRIVASEKAAGCAMAQAIRSMARPPTATAA